MTGGGSEKQIKIIYDKDYYRSESRDSGVFLFSVYPSQLKIWTGKGARKRQVELVLIDDSDEPSVNDLSFVLESVSPYTGECEVAQVFRNLTIKCIGKGSGWRTATGVSMFNTLNRFLSHPNFRSNSCAGAD